MRRVHSAHAATKPRSWSTSVEPFTRGRQAICLPRVFYAPRHHPVPVLTAEDAESARGGMARYSALQSALSTGKTAGPGKPGDLDKSFRLERLHVLWLVALGPFWQKHAISWFVSNAHAEISMLQLRESTRRASTGLAELHCDFRERRCKGAISSAASPKGGKPGRWRTQKITCAKARRLVSGPLFERLPSSQAALTTRQSTFF